MPTVLEQRKAELEQRKADEAKIELYRRMIRHLTALVYIMAELHLGYKPDLK